MLIPINKNELAEICEWCEGMEGSDMPWDANCSPLYRKLKKILDSWDDSKEIPMLLSMILDTKQ